MSAQIQKRFIGDFAQMDLLNEGVLWDDFDHSAEI